MKSISRILLSVLFLAGIASGINATAAPGDKVSGVVKDAKGNPIVGAVITDEAQKAYTLADDKGEFSFNPTTSRITVSCLGYQSKTVSVKPGQKITIVLEDEDTLLDDAVVVGYAVQSKANLTGAVSTVDVGQQLAGRSIPDVGRGLQGAAPGLSVTLPDAEVGSDARIRIRGAIASLEGGASPLILVDNVEVPSLQVVNTDDVESISVLKDAASTSIYGAKAAFGVILITTKKGEKSERVTVSYSGMWSFENLAKDYDMAGVNGLKYMLDAAYRAKASYSVSNPDNAQRTPGKYPTDGVRVGSYFSTDVDALQRSIEWWSKYGKGGSVRELGPNDPIVYGRDWYYSGGTNYGVRVYNIYDYLVRENAPSDQHSVNVSGNSGKTTFNIGLGYVYQSGMMKCTTDDYSKYNASVKVETEVNKYITARAGLMYSQREKRYPLIAESTSYSPWLYLYRWSPVFPYGYDEKGNIFRGVFSEAMQANTASMKYNYNNVNVGFTVKPLKDWNIVADYNFSNQEYIQLLPGTTFSAANWKSTTPQPYLDANGNQIYVDNDGNPVPSTADGAQMAYFFPYVEDYVQNNDIHFLSRSHENSYRHTFNGYTDYTLRLAEAHVFKAMLGMNLSTYDRTGQTTRVADLSNYENPQFAFGTGVWTGSGKASWESQVGFFGRLNYSFKDRYLLEANLRRDGSSKFPTNLRWAWFPSFSAGWRIIEEPWMEPLKQYISTLKTRVSWGSVGDQTVSSWLYLPQISTGQNSWINGNGALSSYAGTPSTVSDTITWQTIKSFDAGIDARFLDSHIGFTFDYFIRDTENMIVPTDGVNTVTYGASAPKANLGSLRTNGWEFQIDGNWRFSNGLGINAMFQLADATSKITAYGDTKSLSSWYVGKTYGEIWGFQVDRLYQFDDFETDADGNLIFRELTAADTDDPACIGKASYILKPGPNGEKPVYQSYFEGSSFHFGPGDVKYKDVNGDGILSRGTRTTDDHGDLVVIGNETPRYEYSFRIGADWKGVDLTLFFQGVGKRNIWGQGPIAVAGFYTSDGAMAASFADDYWTVDNTDAFYPAAYNMDRDGSVDKYNYLVNDRYLLNMAYLRLKNFTVGYTLPSKITKKVGLSRFRVYFTAENFLTWDNLRGLPIDPECITGYSMWGSNYAQGWTGVSTPVFKTMTFGTQINF